MNKGKALWLLATVGVLACAGGPPVGEPMADAPAGATGMPRIEAIDAVVTPDHTRVFLRSETPLLYTSYEPDPTTLVLEIQDVDTSALPSTIEVDGEAVGEIRISTEKKSKNFSLTRLEFSGLNILDYSLRSEGTSLVLDFVPSPFLPLPEQQVVAVPAPQPEPEAAFQEENAGLEWERPEDTDAVPFETAGLEWERPEDTDAVPFETAPAAVEWEPSPPAEPVPFEIASAEDEEVSTTVVAATTAEAVEEPETTPNPAKRLLDVDPAAMDDGVRITLRGDGEFNYRSFTLENPDRVVLDLVGVRNVLGNRHLQVGADPVDQVRVAQFRDAPDPVTRVVFDLMASVPFPVSKRGQSLEVLVGEGAVVAAATAPRPEVTVDAEVLPPAPEPAAATSDPDFQEAASEAVADWFAPSGQPAADADPVAPAVLPAATGEMAAAPDTRFAQAPLDLGQLGMQPPLDEYVLFDQGTDSRQDAAAQGAVPPQFRAMTIAGERQAYTGEKISLHFVEADLKNVFLFFSEFIGLNIVIDPEVGGTLTMHLDQVPWDQAFDVILRHQGLEKLVEGNVVRIATTEKLRAEAAQRQALKKAQEDEVDPVTFTKVLSYAKVTDVVPILQEGVRSDRGRVVQDERTNTLIITDVPAKREAYQRLIDVLDQRTQQVMIEARIVETDRNFEHNLGINWSLFASADPALGTQTDLDFPHRATLTYDVALPAAANAGTLGLSLGNVLDSFTLDIALEAFENEGKVRILSSPRITTQNNQTATIEQGTQIPVVTTTAVEINVQYISASLKLQVTPQITADETVIMDILIENNSPDFVNRVGDVPPIITEKATTQILVRDGSTAVIGGIFKLSESKAEAGIPGLRKIPVIGWLFKNRAISKQNTELLVFITPKILKNDT